MKITWNSDDGKYITYEANSIRALNMLINLDERTTESEKSFLRFNSYSELPYLLKKGYSVKSGYNFGIIYKLTDKERNKIMNERYDEECSNILKPKKENYQNMKNKKRFSLITKLKQLLKG